MTYATLDPPLAEPLGLAEAKAHLRLDSDDEDALVLSLIATARDYLERETGLCLIDRTLRFYLDSWPADGSILLARGPVQAVIAVTLYDGDGDATSLDTSAIRLGGEALPARLRLPEKQAPAAVLNGVEVDFIAGFGSSGAEVPHALKQAMLCHVALMFAFRGAVAAVNQPAAVPEGYDRLIAAWRVRRI